MCRRDVVLLSLGVTVHLLAYSIRLLCLLLGLGRFQAFILKDSVIQWFSDKVSQVLPGFTHFSRASSSLLLNSSAMMKWLLATSAPGAEFQSLGVGKECSDTLILGEIPQNGVHGPPSPYQISIVNCMWFFLDS